MKRESTDQHPHLSHSYPMDSPAHNLPFSPQASASSTPSPSGGMSHTSMNPSGMHIPEGIRIANFWGNAKSAVWRYFGFLADDDGVIMDRTRAVCKLCRVSIRFSGNTTNLGNHMHKYHPEMECTLDSKCQQVNDLPLPVKIRMACAQRQGPVEVRPMQNSQQNAAAAVYQNQNYQQTHSSRGQQVHVYTNQMIRDWLAKDLVPVEVVQGAEFTRLMQTVDNKFQLPPATFFNEVMLSMAYNEVKTHLSLQLSVAEHVCLRPEIWTNACGGTHVSFFGNFVVSSTYQRKTCLLGTIALQSPLSTRKLATSLQRALGDWNLLHKDMIVISDDSRITDVADSFNFLDVVPCVAEIINRAVEACYMANDTIASTRDLCWDVMHILQSNTAASMEYDLRAKFDCTLPLDHRATWVVTHDVMMWIATHVDIVNNILLTQSVISGLELTEDLQALIREITDSLSQLRLAVTMLVEQDPPPLSVILPLLQRLFNSKLVESAGDSTVTKLIKSTVMRTLKDYYDQTPVMDLLKIASVLDPRFKSVQFLPDPSAAHQLVKQKALELHRMQNNPHDNQQQQQSNVTDSLGEEFQVIIKDEPDEEPSVIVSVEPEVKKPRMDATGDALSVSDTHNAGTSSAMSIFFDDDGDSEEAQTPETSIESEIKRYLNEEKVPMAGDPSEWWQSNASKYPLLSVMASKYMCVPATAKPPSRIYCNGNDVFARKRMALPPSAVDLQLFLYYNMLK